MVLAYLECFIVCVFLILELVVRLYCQEYLLFHSLFLWKMRTEFTQAAFGSDGAGNGKALLFAWTGVKSGLQPVQAFCCQLEK